MHCGDSMNNPCKYVKMKQLVAAIQEYLEAKNEETLLCINMNLQSFSVTIDLSIFDPNTNIASQFYVNLYQLMNTTENSGCLWKCVDVLANACMNPSARYALIHTYQFIPCLTRLLSDQLSTDRKIQILRLMQDLTCGIKISWQIPHLPKLMTTLSNWIQTSTNADIVSLSLGTLVNLVYKNLPAIYTLLGNVDVRKILKVCNVENSTPIIALYVIKLSIILDFSNGDISEVMLIKVIDASFKSIIESFRIRDLFVLRQVVEFILDLAKNNSLNAIFEKKQYENETSELIRIVDTKNLATTGDTNFQLNTPECIGLVFEFINFLIPFKKAPIINTYKLLIELSMKWINTELVSAQALSLLKTIAINLDEHEKEILAPIVQALPIFIATLDSNAANEGQCIEEIKKKCGLLELLQVMAQVESIRPKIIDEFHQSKLEKLFAEFFSEDANEVKVNAHISVIEQVNLYVHAISLAKELAQHSRNGWTMFFESLMQNKQIHLILAQSLYESTEYEKTLVLKLTSNKLFPHREIAKAMALVQPMSTQIDKKQPNAMQDMNVPVLSISQIKGIDAVLQKFQEIIANKSDISVLTSDVMELYEYKLASMANAERNAMASVSAASERCTHLQHRIAQLTAELNSSHQLLYRTQQCRELLVKTNHGLNEELDNAKSAITALTMKTKGLKNDVSAKEEEIAEMTNQLKESENRAVSLKQVISKLEANGMKLEQSLIHKDEIIKQANCKIDYLNDLIKQLENQICNLESTLDCNKKDLEESNKIIEYITKVASSKKRSDN